MSTITQCLTLTMNKNAKLESKKFYYGHLDNYYIYPFSQKINCTLWLVGIIFKNEFADEFTDLSPIYRAEQNIQTNTIFFLSIFVNSIEEIDTQNGKMIIK